MHQVLTSLVTVFLADDPKPEAGASNSNGSAAAPSADEQAKSLDQVRELCPDLAAEIEKENGKEEICKKCKNIVSYILLYNLSYHHHLEVCKLGRIGEAI